MINLDPAADDFKYPVSGDVRDLISLSEVMKEMDLGPNGALLYSMEYLEDNLENWLSMTLEGYDDGDCVIFDCPGQIELYSHHSTFRAIADQLQAWSWHVITVYILDAQFVTDGAKYIAGCLQCQAAMMNLELPHINILSKVDLVEDKATLEPFITPDAHLLSSALHNSMETRYHGLNNLISSLLEEYSLVTFHPLDVSDENSLVKVLYTIDSGLQYGEDADVNTSREAITEKVPIDDGNAPLSPE